MARTPDSTEIRCYYCEHLIEVSRRTMSTSCPLCHKSLRVEDIVVKGYTGVSNLETCGRLIVHRRGHAVAQHRVVAQGGIEVQGRLQCENAKTAGTVFLSAKSIWRGNLSANGLVVEEGAVIEGAYITVPLDNRGPPIAQDFGNDWRR